MDNSIAKVLIFGDSHLSSKSYGGHRDYPNESLYYLREVTRIAKEREVTHMVGLGDLTYGRFHNIEYREKVDEILEEQHKLTNGNRYELKGNHDIATYGKTERDYYIKRGLLKDSKNIQIGLVNINMVDYGKEKSTEVIIEKDKINIILAHGYFKFKDTALPTYGTPVLLDNFEKWYGVNYIISGHIHNEHRFKGSIIKENKSVETLFHYLPCLARPAYQEGNMPEVGTIVMLNIFDNGTMEYECIDIPLWDIEKSFNITMMEKKQEHKNSISIDISDVVDRLNNHKSVVGNPEDIIHAMSDIDIRYREKAIELLKESSK